MSVRISDAIISNEKLSQLYDMFSYLYGPNSNCIMLNHKTLSSSIDLFTFLSPKCDVIKMMLAYLKNQTMVYKDGGLFAAIVTVDLIRRYKLLNVSLPVVMDTNDDVITEVERLTNELAIEFDIGKLKEVSIVIKSILSSKLTITHCELEHLIFLFARAFTNHNPLQNTHVILNHVGRIEDCELHDGLLLRLDRYFTEKKTFHKDSNRKFRVILISVALALDSEELFSENGSAKILTESVDDLKENVLQQIIEIGNLLSSSVDIVICQKVVHPTVKRILRQNNVLCVDRVGGNIMPLLARRCNCHVVSSLVIPDMNNYVVEISDVEINESGANFYLKINSQLSSFSSVKTLMLVGKNEDEVNALHRCFETCMVSLSCLSRNNYVVCGGGCMETQLSFRLRKTKQQSVETLCNDVIIKSLLSASMAVSSCDLTALHHSVDNMFYHHWVNAEDVSSCCCGAVKKHKEIKFIGFLELLNSPLSDTFPVNKTTEKETGTPNIVHVRDIFVHNVRSAFELANLVLRIGIKILPN